MLKLAGRAWSQTIGFSAQNTIVEITNVYNQDHFRVYSVISGFAVNRYLIFDTEGGEATLITSGRQGNG